MRCPDCDGVGEVAGYECAYCDGCGEVESDDPDMTLEDQIGRALTHPERGT